MPAFRRNTRLGPVPLFRRKLAVDIGEQPVPYRFDRGFVEAVLSIDQVVGMIGLAAGIHTRDLNKALRYARRIEAGQVYINGYHGAGRVLGNGAEPG